MEFEPVRTLYALEREKGQSVEEFYARRRMLRHMYGEQPSRVDDEIVDNQELAFYEDGRPYFRVFPDYLPYLTETSLNFPAEFFRLPFRSFAIQLPKDQAFVKLGPYSVQYVTVYSPFADAEFKKLLMRMQQGKIGKKLLPLWAQTAVICDYIVVFGHFRNSAGWGFAGGKLAIYAGRSTEDAFNAALSSMAEPGRDTEEMAKVGVSPADYTASIEQMLRLAVAISFLSVGNDRIVEPDILSRDLVKYLDAVKNRDLRQVQQLRDRATSRRQGQIGFTVGRAARLPHPHPVRSDGAGGEATGTGRELNYQHQRRAHMHGFRTKTGYVVHFLPLRTVRPDLPLPPDPPARGYDLK